ncbi:hypothetical protein PENTCL1PPCAC_28745, partial [Pristionchus entomophagus]
QPFITYHVLGHELYHSLFWKHSPTLLTLYSHRGECVMDHYQNSCGKKMQGACKSGKKTFTEDAPDIEALRLLYAILRENYRPEQLSAQIDGLDTTLEQSFFYYTASVCGVKQTDQSEHQAERDPHSAGNIRVNAAVSLMPEFSRAFQCKEGDPMFIDEKDS